MKPQRFIALLCATMTLLLAGVAFPIHTFAQVLTFPDGTLIKASGPEVDRMQGGLRRWIPDPTTFSCMGLSWGMVQTITDSAWQQIPVGRAYPSRTNRTLLQGSGPAVYVMNGCQRHWIPDPATFDADGYKWSDIQHIANADLWAIPLGAQIPPVQDTLTANRYQQVGRGFYMQTNVNMVKHNGIISAVTRTWDRNIFLGFTGGVYLRLLDRNGMVIATTQALTFSVTGRYLSGGQSDRSDQWSEQIDPQIATQTATVQIIQYLSQVNWPGAGNNATRGVTRAICAALPKSDVCQNN